jgi:hypothetical protein
MYKQSLLNNIEKEIDICCRLSTKIKPDQLNFKPKEGLRSVLELLQYLSTIGVAMPKFWLTGSNNDFNSFFKEVTNGSKAVTPENFIPVMKKQKEEINKLFLQLSDDDLINRQINYPWGGSSPLGEAIIATSIKWLSAYKLQLFQLIKISGDESLGTADAWVLTDI